MASRVFATALRAASRRAIVPAVARPVAAMASANLKQTAVKASVSIVCIPCDPKRVTHSVCIF